MARKTFVDNVCRQVIERHILSELPDIFSPPVVTEFSDEELMRMASEPQKQRDHRASLQRLAEGLRESIKELRN